jgi:lipid A 3-O-deacylase
LIFFLRVVAAIALCTHAAAEPSPRWYVQLDNDFFFFTDRWYSSGLRVARVAPHEGHEIELAVQQDIYTPDAKNFELGQSDRAPAARLYAAIARHDRAPGRLITWEGTLGVRGPAALGEESTDFIHRIIAAREVQWSRQRGNALEAQATYSRSDRFDRLRLHHGLVVGTTHAFAHAGAEWRFGNLSAADLMSPALRFAPTPPWDGDGRQGWSGFLGASARAVARDEILRDSYDPRVPPLQRERFVTRFAAGVSWAASWGALVFSAVSDTRVFEGQTHPHRFGSLTVHLPF